MNTPQFQKQARSFVAVLITLCFSSFSSFADTFFVAPGGLDTNPGTEASPFATIERAKDAARNAEGSIVKLAPGTYRLTKTVAFDKRDSHTTYSGSNARITGSIEVSATSIKTVTDPGILERLLPEVRGKVLEIDLHALGISEIGDLGPRGFRRPYIPAPIELFVDDEPLSVARWPKREQPGILIGKVIDPGSRTRNGEKPTKGGTFEFDTERPARWKQADDVWITGLFSNGYADNTVKVKSFDLEKKTITTVHPHMYGFASGKPWQNWVALNLLEEIEQPGEFMADQKTGKLYFLPPTATPTSSGTVANTATPADWASSHRIELSVMKEPLVAVEGADGVVFDGVNFECSRGIGVYIERGANCRVQNATLRNLGIVAICIGKGVSPDPNYQHGFTGEPLSRELGSWHEHIYNNSAYNREAGTGHGVINCKIYNIGAGGISMGGGDRVTLQPGGNFVENCEIHDFNRWDRSYRAAVNIDGVGNIIRHCLLYNCPGSAIYLHGNEHLIEYNEVHHAVMDGDDMGAFYMGRDPTERGNIIRYNYWHDLAPSHITLCIYFDDSGGDGSQVYGNIFRNTGKNATIFVNGSSHVSVMHNLFIDCKSVIGMGASNWRTKSGLFEASLKAVHYDQTPWREKYPELLSYFEDIPKMPFQNVFSKNLLINSKLSKSKQIKMEDNLTISQDVGIPGFEPIPFDQIGLQTKEKH